jgi:RND family efflux transporter MFP subunit
MTSTRTGGAWVLASLVLSACGGASPGGGGAPGGGPPPMPVEIVNLEARPVEQTTEFVAILKSRRSSMIQPQVEGFITRIAVRSGERVAQGATLFEVDSRPQQAVVASQQSIQAMRAAEVEYARQQAERTRKLFEAGAASLRDAEEADTALRTSEAQLKTAEDQVRQQRAELGYYQVAAPSAGVVGDIPVRVGDRVTQSTELTTVNQHDAFEVNISVPVAQASGLKPGLPVRIIDDAGAILFTNRITFVSPSVDPATQTVLAKAAVVEGRGKFRADQFVRVRIVWRSEPGLTLPVTAAMRVNGQYFVLVAEKSERGLVARQRAVKIGEIIGNDYVVLEGLKPGDQLIVAGIQKIGDGSPVSIAAPASAPPPASEPTKGS